MFTTQTLTAENLSCTRQEKLLFANLNFELAAGEALIITGHNGSGKSTLLRLLAGLMPPTSGKIGLAELSPNLYQQQLHYVGHQNGLKTGLTVRENIQLLQSLHLAPPINDIEVLQKLALDLRQSDLVATLSAGQKRRLAWSRLLLLPRQVWLLDEPFTALDAASQSLLKTFLELHLAKNGILVMTTHHALALEGRVKHLSLPLC